MHRTARTTGRGACVPFFLRVLHFALPFLFCLQAPSTLSAAARFAPSSPALRSLPCPLSLVAVLSAPFTMPFTPPPPPPVP